MSIIRRNIINNQGNNINLIGRKFLYILLDVRKEREIFNVYVIYT